MDFNHRLKMREQTRWEPGERVPDGQQQNAKPPKQECSGPCENQQEVNA